jgi:hypothetical protein
MIGYYKMSLIGSSHLSEEDGVCQDSSDAKPLQNGWIIAAIADGLGSAKHSAIGSDLAVKEVLRFIETNIPDSWHDESLISLLRTAFHATLKQIKEKAAKDKNSLKDYDTTLTSVIYNGTNAVFGHVGDGGIIALNPYGEFSILTVAQKGEEFNTVTPLRASPDSWLFGASNESIAALLMLTDGVYDVACPWLIAKQEQKIYVNYVRPLMDRNILPVATPADFEDAEKEIAAFFTSEQSRHITDDKTILGIINTDILPESKPDEYYAEPDWQKLAEIHREKLYGSKSAAVIRANIEEPTNVALKEPATGNDDESKQQAESSDAKSSQAPSKHQRTDDAHPNTNNSIFSYFSQIFKTK